MSTALIVSEETQKALAKIPTDRDKKLNQTHLKIFLKEFDSMVEGRSHLIASEKSRNIDRLMGEYVENNSEVQNALEMLRKLVDDIESCFLILAKNGVDANGRFVDSENPRNGQWRIEVGEYGTSDKIQRAFKSQTKLVNAIQAERDVMVDPFSGARMKLAVSNTYGEAAKVMNLVAGKEIL